MSKCIVYAVWKYLEKMYFDIFFPCYQEEYDKIQEKAVSLFTVSHLGEKCTYGV